MTEYITWASVAVIILVFALFAWEEWKLYNIKEAIKKMASGVGNITESLKGTKVQQITTPLQSTSTPMKEESQTFLHQSISTMSMYVSTTS